jgi:hypothetical protein
VSWLVGLLTPAHIHKPFVPSETGTVMSCISAVGSELRYNVTSPKVADSIPCEVIGFFQLT